MHIARQTGLMMGVRKTSRLAMNRLGMILRGAIVTFSSILCVTVAFPFPTYAQTPANETTTSPGHHALITAGYDYKRPPIASGSRLVFIGDSITDMKWGRNEKDRNHYLGHSFVYLIASRLHTDIPETELEFFNRGKSGNTVSDLRTRWQTDAIEMKPDWLTILIGVNDVGRACRAGKVVDLKKWEADYRHILTASRQANPNLKIVLMDPFVLPVARLANSDSWQEHNGECTKLRAIVQRLSEEFEAIHVPTQSVFDKACDRVPADHWIWDGVHPLPQGHELIARNWIEIVSTSLERP